jgi:hypothetical protein
MDVNKVKKTNGTTERLTTAVPENEYCSLAFKYDGHVDNDELLYRQLPFRDELTTVLKYQPNRYSVSLFPRNVGNMLTCPKSSYNPTEQLKLSKASIFWCLP